MKKFFFGEKISKSTWLYILIALLFLILLLNRSLPYLLYGPFGFGYDTGIYKKAFESITSLSSLFHSEISFFPSFLAYLFNIFSIPLDFFLYHFYIFISVFLAWPIYLLTKEYFGRAAGITAIVIFTVSYVQVLASEFYLFKAILGAIFMFLAFYYYSKKSYIFYIFVVLLALTQLPQMLILAAGVALNALVEGKKDLKFHLYGFLSLIIAISLIFILNPSHLINAANVVISSLQGVVRTDYHNAGLFMTLEAFFMREFWLICLGIIGIYIAHREAKIFTFFATTVFVVLIVFLGLFFQSRYIVELDLLFIPFASYALVVFWKKFLARLLPEFIIGILFVFISLGCSYWYYSSTLPALSDHEVWAMNVIREKNDSSYVMVTNSLYAPWFYGFSEKKVLAPGIFEAVWDFDDFIKYNSSEIEVKQKMLFDISKKYGKYYLFEGLRGGSIDFQLNEKDFKKIFDVQGVQIYEVSPL